MFVACFIVDGIAEWLQKIHIVCSYSASLKFSVSEVLFAKSLDGVRKICSEF